MRIRHLAIMVAVLAMVLTACASDSDSIDVSLSEWKVEASPGSVPAGEVTFNATNDGGEAHEMVIVKGIAPEDLPVDADGKVIEDDLPEGAFIGEIEEFEAGTTETATFDLAAGTYTLFCNILEEDNGETESHFQNGMVTTITLEG